MPTYLELAYDGNYAGRVCWPINLDGTVLFAQLELFTYRGNVYTVDYHTEQVSVY
jgi:hypothetical protein